MSEYKLTGLITAYQLNNGIYNLTVEKNYFRPKNDSHCYSIFVGGFTSASQEHFHYENGVNHSFSTSFKIIWNKTCCIPPFRSRQPVARGP
ncbi:DUF7710 domain-containing protein [Aeromonas sp. 96A]|uniref:DUF7710 domain-containing protein n=1 Tax=Aeromonas TaxID=642 RepID=UPI003B3A5E6D